MGYVDFILNLAGLLLWLNWRSNRFDPLVRRRPATLMGTLRPATPKKFHRWHVVALITGLLFLRALIYRWLGPAATNVWVGQLDLGVTTLSFRSDWFARILIYSFLSFGRMLGIFYVWLLLLSLLAGPDPIHGLVKIPLGRADDWPRGVKAVLPLVATAVLWGLASWLLCRLQILPPVTAAGRFQQALVLGANSYLLWQFPLVAILLLHLLNSYIYFGKHPFWNYVSAVAQTVLRPLKKFPLRLGKVDFAPLVGVILVFLLANILENGIHLGPRTGEHGRAVAPWLNLPGLADLYRKLPF